MTKNPTKRKQKQLQQIAAMILIDFFVNTGYKQGKPGMSKVYFAPLSAITAQPEPPTSGTIGATSIATGSWTFASEVGFTTNGFIDMCNDLLKGAKILYAPDGDQASPAEKTTANCRVIGWDAEILERARKCLGIPMTFAIRTPDCTSTEYWIVGCTCGAAYLKPTGDTDELGGTGGKRFDFVIMANCAPYKWSGTLPLKAV